MGCASAYIPTLYSSIIGKASGSQQSALQPRVAKAGSVCLCKRRQEKQHQFGVRSTLQTPWGPRIRSPIDAKGWLVFQPSMENGASDIATESTSGFWEAYKQSNGRLCNYCSRHAVNVYGHWSYTVEFKRSPNATEICDVPVDHAEQKKL